MKDFDTVVIGCDTAYGSVQEAENLRAMLENLSIRVHLYRLVQKQHVLDLLSRQHSETDYVIVFCHGCGSDDEPGLRFEVVDKIEGELDRYGRERWQNIKFDVTPHNIPQLVKNARGTLISLACASGRQTLADAFLSAGYRGYIAPTDWHMAGSLFLTGFFHHLRQEDRDDPVFPAVTYTDQEAVALAALHGLNINDSVQTFRYFE